MHMLSDSILRISKRMYGVIPEGRPKHVIRVAAMKLSGELPKRAFVNQGEVVVQVGTPSTGMVRYLLELVGPSGQVIVIEPEAKNFRNLESDSVIAAARNVVLVKKGAWSRRGKLELTVSKDEADHKIAIPGIVHDNDYVPGNYVGGGRD